MTLRCVAFVSVSSDEQAEEGKTSLEDQAKWCADFIAHTIPARYGAPAAQVETLKIVGSRKIILFSDAIATHEAYNRLHQLIITNAIDVLVAMKMNRVAREESLAITIRDLCLAHGIIPAWGDGLPPTLNIDDLRRDEGWRISGMVQAWGSGREVRELGDKVRAGRKGRVVEKRRFIAAPPYGYLAARDGDDERIAILHPDQAPIVRMIFVDYYLCNAWGAERIAGELNRLGVVAPSGEAWTISGVQTLLQRARIYTGQIAYGRFMDGSTQWLDGQHPAILTAKEYVRVEQEQERRHPGAPRRYPFSGFVYCAKCNRPMQMNVRRRTKADGSPAADRYLRCRSCNGTVTEGHIRQALGIFLDAIEQDGFVIPTGPDTRAGQLDTEIARLRGDLHATQTALERLLAAYESGAVPLDILNKRMTDRRKQAAELDSRLAAAERTRRELQASGNPVDRIAAIRTHARAVVAAADTHPEQCRNFLCRYVRIDVHSPRDLSVTPILHG